MRYSIVCDCHYLKNEEFDNHKSPSRLPPLSQGSKAVNRIDAEMVGVGACLLGKRAGKAVQRRLSL
jgi:hypothetical protein